jgi:hypothetical protein
VTVAVSRNGKRPVAQLVLAVELFRIIPRVVTFEKTDLRQTNASFCPVSHALPVGCVALEQ